MLMEVGCTSFTVNQISERNIVMEIMLSDKIKVLVLNSRQSFIKIIKKDWTGDTLINEYIPLSFFIQTVSLRQSPGLGSIC